MRSVGKKMLSVLLSLLIVSGIIGVGFYENGLFSTTAEASTGGHTQGEAVAYANSLVYAGEPKDVDGNGAWCVDLIYYYYTYLGVTSFPWGDANTFDTNALPAGWTRVYSDPQPGDIYQTDAGEWGHVAVVTEIRGSNIVVVQQSQNTAPFASLEAASSAKCYIRPDFPSSVIIDNGYYFIQSSLSSNKYVEIEGSSSANCANVQLYDFSGKSNQVFSISKTSDYYLISPLCSGLLLDTDGNSASVGQNLIQYQNSGVAGQHWYFKDAGNEYYSICSGLGTYIDVTNGTTSNGTNIRLWSFNGENAQRFKLLKAYTISYNANGGTGAPETQYKASSVALKLSSTKPTRNGYTFIGWSTSSSATTATYTAGGNYTANSSATLYAVWEQIPVTTYTLKYNANGGNNPPASQTGNGSITISSSKPTRDGYTFKRWNTKSDGTGTSYNPGATFNLTANVTLYAIWELNPVTTFTLTYNANGGTGVPASQTGNGTITLSGTKPARDGYTFLGWATSATATSAQYQPGASFILNANKTLYAVWKKIDTPVTPVNPTASTTLNLKSSASVDYRTDVTITATASNLPSGYFLAIYDGDTLLAKGDNSSVSYHAGEMRNSKTFTVKVVDSNGAVQSNSSGALQKDININVSSGFFAKIIAFFKALFGLLPKVEIKP